MDNINTPNSNILLYNSSNQILLQQHFGEFSSPIIPHMRPQQQTFDFGGIFTSIFHLDANQQRIDKSHWICDYSDDIFQSLRETELKRRLVCFRSQLLGYRPLLLKLLKNAIEKHKLSRTTLHLAVYLLDCFMDNYCIRLDKLNLTAITCLIVAAKIEEADVDMPKFSELNKLIDNAYTLNDFKSLECKVLVTFNFDLIRPTAATFAEYFANSFITLQDFHMFVNHWNNEMILNNYHHQQQQQRQEEQNQLNYGGDQALMNTTCVVLSTPCPYTRYEDMLTTLSTIYFDLIDVSLSYIKFANARPSIIASACIAAVRQMHGVFPIWTPYLVKLTNCTADIISPFVEAILAIYRIYCNNERQQFLQQTPNTPISTNSHTAVLCDSPDSGIVSGIDTKSLKSDTDIDEDDDEDDDLKAAELNVENVKRRNNLPEHEEEEDSEEEDEPYSCIEYRLLPKRRRIF